MFWAVCLVAFFSFLRKSNLLPPSLAGFDTRRHLRREDFTVHSWGLALSIRWSKTIQFSERCFSIPLPLLPGHPLCPVQAVLAAFRLTPAADISGPAFMLPGPPLSPMLYAKFLSILRSTLSAINLPAKDFTGHSLRRGGASWAFQMLLPSEIIKSMGDWASDAYMGYLEIPLLSKVHHVRTFAQALPTH